MVRRIRSYVLVVTMLAVLLLPFGCGMEGDPLFEIYTEDVYPGTTSTYNVGSPTLTYQNGYFDDLFVDGVSVEGKVFPLINTYVSGTGTAGADNTAQDVKTVVIPANTLTQVNDRIRVRVYWMGDTGAAITATAKVNGIIVATSQDVGGADFFATESRVHYVDATHANIIENGDYPATGAASVANQVGFDWTSDQDVVVSQSAAAGNHIIVYAIFLDVLPKGVI